MSCGVCVVKTKALSFSPLNLSLQSSPRNGYTCTLLGSKVGFYFWGPRGRNLLPPPPFLPPFSSVWNPVTCMHAHMYTPTHTHTRTHACTHAHMHSYTCTYAHTLHTCTHAHTHTHTQEPYTFKPLAPFWSSLAPLSTLLLVLCSCSQSSSPTMRKLWR